MDARQRLLRFLVPAVLVTAAAVILFVGLDEPTRIIFDETYYVNDARDFLERGAEDGFAVHPPVGKWLIAAGIAIFGDSAVGWRAAGSAAGAISVLLVYLMGLRLFRSLGAAALATLLLATDGMFMVQARTGMLDIHLALFVVLGAWLLLRDHDRTLAPERDPPADLSTEVPRRSHHLRVLAGVAFGLAVATKWSGVLALIAAIVLAAGWELAQRRRVSGRARTDLGRGVWSVVLGLGVVPVAVYAVTFVPWLVNFADTHTGQEVCGEDDPDCTLTPVDRLVGLVDYHGEVIGFHTGLEAEHSYRAPAYTWPVLARPVVYYYETCSEERAAGERTENDDGELEEPEPCIVEQGEAGEIIGLGNPALWWAFLPVTVLLAAGLARRDRRAGFVVAFYGVQFLPWLVVSRPVFLFYMVPIVPFMALGMGYAVTLLDERRGLGWLAAGTAVGAVLGAGVGLGIEAVADIGIGVARWLALWAGALIGAAVGAALGDRRESTPWPAAARAPLGRWTGVVVALVAVGLFAYFLPVWLGVALPEDTVRERWWFEGWI